MQGRSLAACLTVLGCVLLGGAAAVADDAPRRGGILTYAVVADAPTYDCHAANSFSTIHYLAPHYSTLLRIDPARYPAVIGDLAESWQVSDGGQTYTFRLRPGIRFHDGSPLAAADVKASFDRIRDPPPGAVSVRRAQFADVAAVEAPDERTVIFRTKKPNASLLTLLASPWNCIYSAKLMRENPDYPAKLVMGSGPFRFVEHVAGSKWVGKRFEGYFRTGLPYLDGFEAYVVSSAALTGALQGGQVMAEFRGISPAERDALKQAMGDRIKFQETVRLTNFQLAFNTAKKPFDDLRVRRALTLAIDRWAVEPQLRRTTIAGVTGGLLRPGYALARSTPELEALPGFGRDGAAAKAEARRLLKEAGVENLKFTLTNEAVPNPFATIGIYAIDQWRQIGVTVEQNTLEASRWNAARLGGNFDVVVDFVAEFVDEPSVQFTHYLSHDLAPDNVSRAIDRTLDDLYERQLRATDLAERARLVHAFEERVLRQAYVAPVSWGYRITPLAAKVMGYTTTPSHFLNQDLAEVWLAQ
ncbi:MAG TPA: ABC transporter substrate-binding protein [Stellaceae bacterium]|nr:ABC transporter substrate-binding protein [Stellaceae bacterium]